MATEIVSLVIEIGKLVWYPIKHHGSYLFCYGRYIHTFQDEVTTLEQRRNEVQQRVDQDGQKGRVILYEVEKWLTSADNMKSMAEEEVARSENTKCWNKCCWNPVLCHGLGKEAAKKIISVRDLINNGNFNTVSRSPPPSRAKSLLPNKGFEEFETTKKMMRLVFDALRDDKINIIGVHGMGGVGKTTLMKEVAKQAEQDKLFNKVIMVTVSQTVNIQNIQNEINEQLGLKFEEESEFIRAARLLGRLKQEKKLLVILDDLWDELELSKVGISCEAADKGCKIVIISRSTDVCNTMIGSQGSQTKGCKLELKPLIEEESWNLFKVKAGDVVNSNKLSEIALNIVRECKGLPLAIDVLGLALHDKSDCGVWNAILDRLKNVVPEDIQDMEKKVFQSIKYSYDYLKSEETKLCFLLCCLFPEDTEISQVDITRLMVGEGLIKFTQTLDAAKDQVSRHFDNLKASSLLLEGDKERSIKMHDIIRNVAIWITSKQYGFYSKPRATLKEWPGDIETEYCQRISLQDNQIAKLPHEPLWFPKLCTLLLNGNENLEMIPEGFFSEMKALRVLDLSSTGIRSLPSSLLSLMNLRVLLLISCEQLKDLSGIGALKSLEVLDLSHAGIRVLPTELGELSNLRYLNLLWSKCRIPSGMISQLTRLEELNVAGGFEEWQPEGSEDKSHAAFAELACLSRLRTLQIRIRDERCFHQDLGHGCFQELKRFEIFGSDQSDLVQSDALLTIVASVVPDWAKLLAGRADKLVLRRCLGVEFLDGGLDISITTAFSNINYLQLQEMKDLCRLCQMAPPHGFLANLKTLEVERCDKLANIFSSDLISKAHQLESLKVSFCDQVCHVFHYDSALAGESHDPILLAHLTTLRLYCLRQLTSIWEGGAPRLGNLGELLIDDCDSLKYVFTWGQLRSLALLKNLEIRNCSGMVALIMSDGANSEAQVTENNSNVLPRLKSLHLEDLKIASFDEEGVSLFDWPSLEDITIISCPNLKKLPISSQGALKLRKIYGRKEWFQALEWEDENIKSRLQSLFFSI